MNGQSEDHAACGFEAIARLTGLLDGDRPNLTRFVFTDPRSRSVFPDGDLVADEQVFALSCSPADDYSAAFRSDLSAQAGEQFTRRLNRHRLPYRGTPRWTLPVIGELRWDRDILELPPADAQQLTVLLPTDRATVEAVGRVLGADGTRLRRQLRPAGRRAVERRAGRQGPMGTTRVTLRFNP